MVTNSRYDFMSEGVVADSVSGSIYPDPLTLNYLNFQLEDIPFEETLNIVKLNYFWKVAENHYGVPCWDDIVLTLNGVPHKNLLKENDKIYFPNLESIKNSFKTER